jgi:uncharacterized protein YjiS (DUF1127 family)
MSCLLEQRRLSQPVVGRGFLRLALGMVLLWWHRYRTRRQLGEIDARALKDIGVSRMDAREEARKWFWQP